jgi:hypothetical protein
MKGRLLTLSICILALFAVQAHASVFSGSGGSSLQSLFNSMGYSNIDVADYQTDLNFKLHGMMEFQLLNRSGAMDLSFGVLESRHRWWGTSYRHNTVFGRSAEVGESAFYNMGRRNTTYGFYISKPDPNRWWRQKRYYSFSPYNRYGAVQALFYADPLNSNSYLLAWNGLYVGDSHADHSYDNLVVRLTVHPAPEPATWVLLASGLVGIGVLITVRRKQREMG